MKNETCILLVNSVLPLANPCYIRLCKSVTIDRVPAQVVSGGSAGLIKTHTIKPRKTNKLAASRAFSFLKKA